MTTPSRRLDHGLMVLAVAAGLAIAYMDSRPGWDDTGATAGLLVITAAIFGLIGARRAWLSGLCVGLWIPLYLIARSPQLSSAAYLFILAFPLAGAYLGRLCRLAIQDR